MREQPGGRPFEFTGFLWGKDRECEVMPVRNIMFVSIPSVAVTDRLISLKSIYVPLL